MILVELEDVRRIHSRNPYNPDGPTEYRLTPGERPPWVDDPDFFETDKRFYPGPYLLRVNGEGAWISRDGEKWVQAIQGQSYPCMEREIWHDYVKLYSEAIGISPRSWLSRLSWMGRRLRGEIPGKWIQWKSAYHWPEGSDLTWEGLKHDDNYELREVAGRKEIRYVRR